MHGYAIMQYVDEISQGMVKLGPGTLYGAFSTLEKEGLIKMVSEENRRQCFPFGNNCIRLVFYKALTLCALKMC
jgi:hypothetical protein